MQNHDETLFHPLNIKNFRYFSYLLIILRLFLLGKRIYKKQQPPKIDSITPQKDLKSEDYVNQSSRLRLLNFKLQRSSPHRTQIQFLADNVLKLKRLFSTKRSSPLMQLEAVPYTGCLATCILVNPRRLFNDTRSGGIKN